MVKKASGRLRQRKGGEVILGFGDKPQRLHMASEKFAREMAYALGIWEKLVVDLSGNRDGALLDQLDAFPEISARLGKRPTPAGRPRRAAGKAQVDDGSNKPGVVALEQNCFYLKGW
jgi:hypothetical protein